MRQNIGYEPLMFAVTFALWAGCSNSPSPDLADGPDSAQAVDAATGDSVDVAASLAGEPPTPDSERKPEPVNIADGADSDAPDRYKPLAAERSNNSSGEAFQPQNQEVGDGEAPKSSGRQPDGDDPEAPVIALKIAEPQSDAPLDDGREPSAKPIPEGQRVAVASKSVAPDATELGRDPNAKPGAELTNSAKATPTTKPAAPSRQTLADLSEAIQALDKDSDGQLGLYEWPRDKLAEFKTLDSNKDGFLTPAELVAGQKKPSDKEPTDNKADGADSKDESSADDKPTQGS